MVGEEEFMRERTGVECQRITVPDGFAGRLDQLDHDALRQTRGRGASGTGNDDDGCTADEFVSPGCYDSGKEGETYMMADTRRKMAIAAMRASRIRMVLRVSILCHFMRIAVPKNACTNHISKRFSTAGAGGRTVYREETPAAPVISEVTAITFPT